MRKRFFLFPLFAIAALVGFGFAVMLLWNAILPSLFNVGMISYWQAVGLLILSKLLFGGFHCGKSRWKSHHDEKCGPPHLREKWLSMTDEEREKVKQEWRDRCGWHS